MKYIGRSLAAVTAALALVGCADPESTSERAMESDAMPGNAAPGGAEHVALGTVNSIDRAAGTINISHEPVESAAWPAMTMSFRLAEPEMAAELELGQRVEFRFTMEGGGTVTAIAPE